MNDVHMEVNMAHKNQITFTQSEWKEVLSKVYRRAAMDPEFHALCLRDPHAAIKQATGKDLSKGIKIRFMDESEEIIFMLPAENRNRVEPLIDSQLEELAEGMSILPIVASLKDIVSR